jgi:hypothetical protein
LRAKPPSIPTSCSWEVAGADEGAVASVIAHHPVMTVNLPGVDAASMPDHLLDDFGGIPLRWQDGCRTVTLCSRLHGVNEMMISLGTGRCSLSNDHPDVILANLATAIRAQKTLRRRAMGFHAGYFASRCISRRRF